MYTKNYLIQWYWGLCFLKYNIPLKMYIQDSDKDKKCFGSNLKPR